MKCSAGSCALFQSWPTAGIVPVPSRMMVEIPARSPSSGFDAMFGPMSPWPARPWHFAHTPTNVSLPSSMFPARLPRC